MTFKDAPPSHGGTPSTLDLQLKGYRLATAEILYRLPDTQSLLQTYVWQDFDLSPQFPVLNKFLDFWEDQLDGPLHSVKVTSCDLITPGEMRHTSSFLAVQ